MREQLYETCEKTIKVSPVTQLSAEISARLGEIEEGLNFLLSKIDPILGPNFPVPSRNTASEKEEESGQLVTFLKGVKNRLSSISSTISYSIERVEL